MNDLELVGMILSWLVTEYTTPLLENTHVDMFCDNTSTVTWAQKGSSSRSLPAGCLLRFMHLRQRIRQVSSLLPLHITGENNEMVDISSRAFKNGKYFKASQNLVNYFNIHFPLPQNISWTEFRIPTKLSLRVISCLRGDPLQMESLLNLPKLGRSIGPTGALIPNYAALNRSSKMNLPSANQSSSRGSLQESEQDLTASEIKLKFLPSRMRLRPSPRPLNWLENEVPYTKRQMNTSSPSNES